MSVERITVMPTLPKALRADATNWVEDWSCDLHCEYVVHDYGNKDDAPTVEVIAVQADFGGREWVTIPLHCFSGNDLLQLEDLARDHAQEQEFVRGAR